MIKKRSQCCSITPTRDLHRELHVCGLATQFSPISIHLRCETAKDRSDILEQIAVMICTMNLTFSVVVSVAMFKALLRMGVAAGAKATAEPTRREAIASFMLTCVLRRVSKSVVVVLI